MPNKIINKNHLLVLFSHSFYSIFDFFNKDPECIWSENILCHASILDFVAFHQEWWIKRQSCEQNRHIFPITQEKKKKYSTTSHNVRAQDVFNAIEIMHRKIWYFTFKNTHTRTRAHPIETVLLWKWANTKLVHFARLVEQVTGWDI